MKCQRKQRQSYNPSSFIVPRLIVGYWFTVLMRWAYSLFPKEEKGLSHRSLGTMPWWGTSGSVAKEVAQPLWMLWVSQQPVVTWAQWRLPGTERWEYGHGHYLGKHIFFLYTLYPLSHQTLKSFLEEDECGNFGNSGTASRRILLQGQLP